MKDTTNSKIDKFKSSLMESFDEERLKNIDISIEGYLDKFEHYSEMDIPENMKTVIKDIKKLQMGNEDSLTRAQQILETLEMEWGQ